jgi:hypothetical protein
MATMLVFHLAVCTYWKLTTPFISWYNRLTKLVPEQQLIKIQPYARWKIY